MKRAIKLVVSLGMKLVTVHHDMWKQQSAPAVSRHSSGGLKKALIAILSVYMLLEGVLEMEITGFVK
jgi:hypothetical protein